METGFRWHSRAHARLRPVIRRLAIWTAWAAMALIFSLALFGSSDAPRPSTTTLVLLGALPFLPMLLDRMALSFFRKSLAKHPLVGRTLQFTFNEEGMQMQAPGAESKLAWELVHETITTPEGSLVYPEKGAFHWLPASAFVTGESFSEFKNLLSLHTKNRLIKL